MKFKIGDFVTTNDLYYREGSEYFGKELKHTKLKGEVISMWNNQTGIRDSLGNIAEDTVMVKHRSGIDQFCAKFLKLTANENKCELFN